MKDDSHIVLDRVSCKTPKWIGDYRDARDVIIFRGKITDSGFYKFSTPITFIHSTDRSSTHATWFIVTPTVQFEKEHLFCVNVSIDTTLNSATAKITDTWSCPYSEDLFPCSIDERKKYSKLGNTNVKLEQKYDELKNANKTVATSNKNKNTKKLDAGENGDLVSLGLDLQENPPISLTTYVTIDTIYKLFTELNGDVLGRKWNDPPAVTTTPVPTTTTIKRN